MSEETFLGYFRRGMRRRAHWCKHADSFTEGISDVSLYFEPDWCHYRGLTVWVELKASERWPARPGTKVWWEHYTEHQALFLRARRGWLFARIAKDYLLLDGEQAWRMWQARGWTQDEWQLRALRQWSRRVRWTEFAAAVRGEEWCG